MFQLCKFSIYEQYITTVFAIYKQHITIVLAIY